MNANSNPALLAIHSPQTQMDMVHVRLQPQLASGQLNQSDQFMGSNVQVTRPISAKQDGVVLQAHNAGSMLNRF